MDILEKELDKTFRFWRRTNYKKTIQFLEKYYRDNKSKRRLVRVEIKNNKISFDHEHLIDFYKERGNSIIELFKLGFQKIQEEKTKLPDIILYFTVTDYIINNGKYPIMSFIKEINTNTIVIPDWTFYNPYKSAIKGNWDSTVDSIKKEITPTLLKNKENKIFFQGANTSKFVSDERQQAQFKTDIRANLETISSNNPDFIIKIDKPNIPITEWIKYKYLLDLPGAYAWSVRFKEILNMQSLVIKIDRDVPLENFYSPLIKPGRDYIQIKFHEEADLKKLSENIYNNIIKTHNYMEKHPGEREQIIKNCTKSISHLDMDLVINYMKLILINFGKLIQPNFYNNNKHKHNYKHTHLKHTKSSKTIKSRKTIKSKRTKKNLHQTKSKQKKKH